MLSDHINWSRETLEAMEFKKQVGKLYQRALETVKGARLYGREIDVSNPKEVIATLIIMAEDYNSFHEKF